VRHAATQQYHRDRQNSHQDWPVSSNNGAREFKLFSVFFTGFFAYLVDFAMDARVSSGGGGVDHLPVYASY
jgi:hypothetical protein